MNKQFAGGPDGVIGKKGMINVLPSSVEGVVDNKQSPIAKWSARANPKATGVSMLYCEMSCETLHVIMHHLKIE